MPLYPTPDTPARASRRAHQPMIDPRNPPPRLTRPLLSELLMAVLGLQVSPRTLETWPLETRIVNGRATYDTAEAVAHGRAMLDGAPGLRGGRIRHAT